VVTAVDGQGRLHGLTANSFTSVSLDPPLVLVCVDVGARSYGPLLQQGRFAIHILSRDQAEIARAFAAKGVDRAGICAWRVDGSGYPILEKYLAVLRCRLEREHHAGDHAILIGRVEDLDSGADGERPLVFYGGRLLGLDEVADRP
jgi:flavin reductase ActVB